MSDRDRGRLSALLRSLSLVGDGGILQDHVLQRPIRRASWVAPQSLSNPQRASALELLWIHSRWRVLSPRPLAVFRD
jgi:hypothetical protein